MPQTEVADFLGDQSSNRNPIINACQEMLNLDLRSKYGDMVLREGTDLYAATPINDRISNPETIAIPNFFISSVGGGKEVFCLIQKGTILAIGDDPDHPIVADTLPGFWFWTYPRLDNTTNPSTWVNEWQWLNQTIITKIVVGADATYKSMIKIYGNNNHGLGDDSLIRYTIYNKTRDEFAQIITCKADGDNLRLNISLFDNSWETNDVVIISRSWIDLAIQSEFFNNTNGGDISFHHILEIVYRLRDYLG